MQDLQSAVCSPGDDGDGAAQDEATRHLCDLWRHWPWVWNGLEHVKTPLLHRQRHGNRISLPLVLGFIDPISIGATISNRSNASNTLAPKANLAHKKT
jgi:hypothetical protein